MEESLTSVILRVFGCTAYSHVPSTDRRNLDKKTRKMCFIGYWKIPKRYRLIDLDTDQVITRRDVLFNESDFDNVKHTKASMISTIPELQDEQEEKETVDNEPQEQPRRSLRSVHRPDYYGYTESADTAVTESVEHCAFNVLEIVDPATIEEALQGSHAKEWKQATDSEMSSLASNNTWDLVELPPGREDIGCRWIFKIK